MQTPHDILADLWTLAGGAPAALDAVTLTGEEPVLPSSFRVAAAAQVPIAASALAAAEIGKIYALSRRGKQNLFHELLDVVIERGLSRAPSSVELVWKVDDHGFRLPRLGGNDSCLGGDRQ